MVKKIIQTFKDTLIYSIGTFASKLVGFLLLPLYTKLLSPYEYGIWGIIEITIVLISTLLLMGQNQAFIRFYHENTKDLSTLFSTQFLFLALISILLMLFGLVISPTIAKYFENPAFFLPILQTMFIIIGFRILTSFLLDSFRARSESVTYTSLNILKFIVLLIGNTVFLLGFNLKIIGILYAALGADFIILIALLYKTHFYFKRKFDPVVLKEALHFGMPFIVGSIAWMFLNVGDRYILKLLAGYKAVGVYSTGYKFANVINLLLIQPFSMGFIPLAYKYYHQGDYESYFNNLLKYIVFLIGWGGFVLAVFSPEVIQFVVQSPAYYSAWVVVPFICFAYIFTAATSVITVGFNIKKKTKYNALTTIISAFLNLVLNILFIPIWGIRGAALATVMAFAFRFILVKVLVNKVFYVHYYFQNMAKVILIWLVLFTIILIFKMNLGIRIITAVGFPALLYWMAFFNKKEIQTVLNYFPKMRIR